MFQLGNIRSFNQKNLIIDLLSGNLLSDLAYLCYQMVHSIKHFNVYFRKGWDRKNCNQSYLSQPHSSYLALVMWLK